MPNEILDQIQIRPATSNDEAFIYATWLRSYKHSSRFAQPIPPKTFFQYHHKVVERILRTPQTRTLICCSKEDEKTILGYLVYLDATLSLPPIIQFVYVKMPFRKMGIAKALFDEMNFPIDQCVYTHRVEDIGWIEKRFPNLEYNPYLI